MNCKPGDLAVIVSCQDSFWAKDIGRLVTVVRAWGDGVSWLIKPIDGRGFVTADGRRVEMAGDYDSNLRPIHDPGEDARDETLEWLPVPAKQTEPA